MVLSNDITQNTIQNITKHITDFLDSIGRMDAFKSVISIAVFVLIFAWLLLSFRKRVNKITNKQLESFIYDGKYIPQIYIELSESMEYLRYFIYGNKWKNRIISYYNTIFKGYDGKVILNNLNTKIKSKLFIFQKFKTLKDNIANTIIEFENIRTETVEITEENRETIFYLQNLIYHRISALKQCELLIDLVKAKDLILIGNAGNGKTNILCRLSEVLIKNKIPCLLINAKDINISCLDFVANKLPFMNIVRKHCGLFLKIYNFLLYLLRKNLFIIIDAINENDREVFVESLGSLLDYYSKFPRFKIILSCRSEYFDSRYNQYFDNCSFKPYKLIIDDILYDERAKGKIFSVYSDYYNVHAYLAKHIMNRLLNSLLLMRIFFEVNANQEKCNLELRNAEIYKMYIDMVSSKVEGLDLYQIMNTISMLMVNSLNFDSVKITDLNLSSKDLEMLHSCLDNNLIISRRIVKGTGITERTYEIIYFVFDELRDFCLSRYLLIKDEENQDITFSSLFDFLEQLFVEKKSPLEGVMKYSYYYLKKESNDNACISILDKYGSSDAMDFYDYRHIREQDRLFHNIGISLIFTNFSDLKYYELTYIAKYIVKNPLVFWRILSILLQNEFTHNSPGIEFALDVLLYNHSYEEVNNIVSSFFDDKVRFYSYISSNEPRRIEHLCKSLDALKQANGDFSSELKQLLLLIATIEPNENSIHAYKEYASDTAVLEALKERLGFHGIIINFVNLRGSTYSGIEY